MVAHHLMTDLELKAKALIKEIEAILGVVMTAGEIVVLVESMAKRYTSAQMLSALFTQTARLKERVRR